MVRDPARKSALLMLRNMAYSHDQEALSLIRTGGFDTNIIRHDDRTFFLSWIEGVIATPGNSRGERYPEKDFATIITDTVASKPLMLEVRPRIKTDIYVFSVRNRLGFAQIAHTLNANEVTALLNDEEHAMPWLLRKGAYLSILSSNVLGELVYGTEDYVAPRERVVHPAASKIGKERGGSSSENAIGPRGSRDFFDNLRALKEALDALSRDILSINDPARVSPDIKAVRAYIDGFRAFLETDPDEPPIDAPPQLREGLLSRLRSTDWLKVSENAVKWAELITRIIGKYWR